jgi:hypothetical protein
MLCGYKRKENVMVVLISTLAHKSAQREPRFAADTLFGVPNSGLALSASVI